QGDRHRSGGLDQFADLPVGVGGPEVALQQIAQVGEVLDEDVLVQVVLLDHRLAELRRTRALAHAGERVARQGPHQHVHQERGADEHRDELQQASYDVTAHELSLSTGAAATGINPPGTVPVGGRQTAADPPAVGQPPSVHATERGQSSDLIRTESRSSSPVSLPTLTFSSRSDQPAMYGLLHSGMTGMSCAISSSASWYSRAASSSSTVASASASLASTFGFE